VLLDDQGLRLLPHVDKGWHHVLFSARRASARAPPSQYDSEDSLSVASTHVEDEACQAGHELFAASRRFDGAESELSPLLSHLDCGRAPPPRQRANPRTSLSALGIKAKSPKMAAQSPARQPERLMGKLSLGDRALPKLTDAFTKTHSAGSCSSRSRGAPHAGSLGLSAHMAAEDVSWRDREAMKAKYAPRSSWQPQSRKLDVKLANIRKTVKIGKGNTSAVWLCEDRESGVTLATKEVLVDRDQNRTNMALRELITTYGIDHPSVVTCHNVFYANNAFHIVMEFMDGGSLLDAMKRWVSRDNSYEMPPAVLAKIATDVLQGLEFLHDQLQVVHRDVKPGNILLNRKGEAKLADLGIVTKPGQGLVDPAATTPLAHPCAASASTPSAEAETPAVEWIGTVTYMSPERLTGDAYSYSADIWSLGLVLIEAAIGRYPLTELGLDTVKLQFWDLLDLVKNGENPASVLCHYGSQWASLQAFVSRCLAKDQVDRPRASDLLASIPGVVAGGGSHSGDFFLTMAATVDGKAALAEWVEESLVRGSNAEISVSPAMAKLAGHGPSLFDSGVHNVRDCELQEGLVEKEGLEEDGWL